jgi:hypothetical protein
VNAIAVGDEQFVDGSPPQEFVGQTEIVVTIRFVVGSIRETLPELMLEVQIAPSPAATYSLKLNGAVARPSM